MGIGALVAAVLCISLPETKGQPTAEVVVHNAGNDVIVKESKDKRRKGRVYFEVVSALAVLELVGKERDTRQFITFYSQG